jgi:hypothetical protein
LHGYLLDHWFKTEDAAARPLLFQEYGLARQAEILESRYDIRRHLRIEPDAATAKKMGQLRMQWRTTATGLIAGMEVNALPDGRFRPKMILHPDDSWTFALRITDANWYNMSSHVLRTSLPARYYFDNRDGTAKAGRSLSMPLPLFASQTHWEMGALVRNGSDIQMVRRDTDSSADLTDTFSDETAFRWVNHTDRALLPKVFNYTFDESVKPVTKVRLRLETLDNSLVKVIEPDLSQNPNPSGIPADFRFKTPLSGNPTPEKIADGWYRLSVEVNGDEVETRRVLLRSDVPSDNSLLGLVTFETGVPSNPFSLLDADGALRITNGRLPLFELHWPARQTYWRYVSSKKVPEAGDTYDGFNYDVAARILQTNQPRRLSKAPIPMVLQKTAPPPIPPVTQHAPIPLPTPDDTALKRATDRYISELYL